VKRHVRDLEPDFSLEIQQHRPNSFLQTGFTLVQRLLFFFLTFFLILMATAIVLSCVFYVDLKVSGKGVLEPSNYWESRSDISGTLKNIFVRSSSKVSKGDLLAELSDMEYRVRLSQAKNDLMAARAELKKILKSHKLPINGLATVGSYVKIRSPSSGVVKQILIRQEDRVKKGATLVLLDNFEHRAQLYQAEKDLIVSQAELERRTDKYELSQVVYKDLIPELEHLDGLDDVSEIRMQRAVVQKMVQKIDLLKHRIGKTIVRAPINGKILSSNIEDLLGKSVSEGEVLLLIGISRYADIEAGICLRDPHTLPEIAEQQAYVERLIEQVKLLESKLLKTRLYAETDGIVITPDLDHRVGSMINKGEPLLKIARLDSWRVKTVVPEKDVPKLSLGDTAKIKISAFPFMKFKMFSGKVIDIDNASIPLSKSVLIDKESDDEKGTLYCTVTIKLDQSSAIKEGKKLSFHYGLLADVSIIISQKRIISYVWDMLLGKLNYFSNISTNNQKTTNTKQ
jgi:multidrug resistance efflux pump